MMTAVIKIKKCLQEIKHQFHYDEKLSTPECTVYSCIYCEEIIEVYEDATAGG